MVFKKIFFITIFLVSLSLFSTEFTFIETLIFSSSWSLREVSKSRPFNNELLKYKIFWEIVPVGSAFMECSTEVVNNKKVYHIVTQSMSNPSFDLIYKVRNRTDSYVDYEGFYSLKFLKDQNEAGYKSKDYIIFDHKNNLWFSLLDDTTGFIPTFVQDVVSSLYYLRLEELEVGKKYQINVWTGKIVYPMEVFVFERKRVTVNNKIYSCFKVEPKVDIKSFPLFKPRGRLFVWLTDDEYKIPVRLETKIFIGRVYAELIEYLQKE